MVIRSHNLDTRITSIDKTLSTLRLRGPVAVGIERWRADAAALRFHLAPPANVPRIVAILGGTGTGKSTLVNRLLNANVSATSFRRTFTSGPVAITRSERDLPDDWLDVEHTIIPTDKLPCSGELGRLLVVAHASELGEAITLVDTPDLDGDQPTHHAQADRVFRWAQAILFLVTPEKYQMTELLPYYRLAQRYALPVLFVMNKCEEQAVADDYARQLKTHFTDLGGVATSVAMVFVIPRNDAAYEPASEINLQSLYRALRSIQTVDESIRRAGLSNRTIDLIGRFRDQILAPLEDQRRDADRIIASLKAMETAAPGIDVNPITQQLQRRLQQRSVLYLMGPGRMLDRVRQVPGLLARLPRTAWDLLAGKSVSLEPSNASSLDGRHVPDFRAALVDQFRVVQSRIDDVLRASGAAETWIASDDAAYQQSKLDPEQAGKIVDEELADLRGWLERRWNGTPRDTAVIMRLLKYLPGGEKLTKLSEAAPYLLAVIVATHHAFFGHVDLLVLGGYSLFTWLTERISNEVSSRTRQTNRRLADRFGRLAHEQLRRTIDWSESQTPSSRTVEQLRKAAEELEGAVE